MKSRDRRRFQTLCDVSAIWLISTASILVAAEDIPPLEPILRLNPEGPTAFVTSLAFDPTSQTLYAGGWDKVVHAWTRNGNGRFLVDKTKTLRVPVGPGLSGAINAIAVSPDGRYVAIGGLGVVKGEAGFRQKGVILPKIGGMTDEMRRDEGAVFVIDTRTREVRTMRNHLSAVLTLAFAPGPKDPPLLVSAAAQTNKQLGEQIGAVRLWDVNNSKLLGELDLRGIDRDAGNSLSPGLAVQRWGPAPLDLQVAISWNDRKLRMWDVRQNLTTSYEDGRNNVAVAIGPGLRQLLTASRQRVDGSLRVWNLVNAATIQSRPTLPLPPAGELHFLPQAAVWLSGNNYAAVAAQALRQRNEVLEWKGEDIELQLVDLGRRKRVMRARLWTSTVNSGFKWPKLAVSPDGQFLAVGGAPSHEVRVFRVADVLKRQIRPQRLRSKSSHVMQARLVRRDNRNGLYVKEGAANQGHVLDFTSRELVPFQASDGWITNEPKQGGLEIRLEKNGRWIVSELPAKVGPLRVRGPNLAAQMIPLPEEQEEISAWAILPPGPKRRPALLAVAAHKGGEPWLALFNAETGDQLRQYTGHTERLRSLSFSADGRFLISSSEDQTARIWSLTDLDEVLGRLGGLPGVVVDDDAQGGVVVKEIKKDSPAKPLLTVGDRLLGHVAAGGFKAWSDARAFYKFWLQVKPGTAAKVRHVRPPQDVREIQLKAGQGIDERKPLFSLFVARAEPEKPRQWIGWSPFGPFESSDQEIERYLGWHFNTGDPQRPTKFADLNQYRDKYYRQGLLGDLLREGALKEPPDPGPTPQPVISLWIPEVGVDPAKSKGQWLLRDRSKVTLVLNLEFGFPKDKVAKVECRFDDRLLGEFEPTGELRWQMDLSGERWTPGVHRIESIVHTRENTPQKFPQDVRVRYQPLPPEIKLLSAKQAAVEGNQFNVQASVEARSTGTPFVVKLREFGGQELRTWKSQRGRVDIDEPIPVQPGANPLQIIASNNAAAEAYTEFETETTSFVVTAKAKQRASPPKIALNVVAPLLHIANIDFGQRIVVAASQIEIQGKITGADLSSASLRVGNQKEKALAGFAARPNAEVFNFRDTIEMLESGQATTVSVLAQSGKGNAALRALWEFSLVYEPPLPEMDVAAPAPENRVVVQDPAGQATARIAARMRFPKSGQPPSDVLEKLAAAVSVVNGLGVEAEDVKAEVDAQRGTIIADVPLMLGKNLIEMRVKYPWDKQHYGQSEAIQVSCIMPPAIDNRLRVEQEEGQPDAQLVIDGATIDGGVSQITIGERPLPADSWRFNSETQTLDVRTRIIPKLNRSVAISVHGLRQPFEFEIPDARQIARPKRLPEVEFDTPNENIRQRDFVVKFVVRSKSPLKRIELRQSARKLLQLEGQELQDQLRQTQAGFRLEKTVPVELELSENHFVLTAINADGPSETSRLVNFIPLPPDLVIEGLKTLDGEVIPREQPVRGPVAKVVGSVTWDDHRDPRLREFQATKVWVNGFQQGEISLLPAPAGGRVRKFENPVLFSRQDNLIEIGLSLEHEQNNITQLKVQCSQPNENQRCHLLVIGVGPEADGSALVKQAVAALEGELDPQLEEFTTPVFGEGIVYAPLTGKNLESVRVRRRLLSVKDRIQSKSVSSKRERFGKEANDVVVIYYAGGELVKAASDFYLTTEPDQDVESLESRAISSKMLAKFAESEGAHLFLLDVARRQDKDISQGKLWPATSHGAMLRYAWINPKKGMPEAHLIAELRQVASAKTSLGELNERLYERYERLKDDWARQYADPLRYDRHVPSSLETLRLR